MDITTIVQQDYVLLPYPMSWTEVEGGEKSLQQFVFCQLEQAQESVLNLYERYMIKVPTIVWIQKEVYAYGEELKSQLNNQDKRGCIDKHIEQFFQNFIYNYNTHLRCLAERTARLIALRGTETSKQIITISELLCLQEAILLLGTIQEYLPKLDMSKCFV